MTSNAQPDSVLGWLSALQDGDADAAHCLWVRYYPRLLALAARRLPERIRRTCDEDDIATSAFASFCRAAEQGRLPRIDHRDSLWKILAVMTARKVTAEIRRSKAKKRGCAEVRGESIFEYPHQTGEDGRGIGQVVGREPSPEFVAAVSEQLERLLAALPHSSLRAVAVDKLAGFTNAEIAERLGCVERTVVRKLHLVRAVWQQLQPTDNSQSP